MVARLIRVSSRATGARRHVRVYIYDTLDELRDAARNHAGETARFDHAVGVCQTWNDAITRRVTAVIVRLCKNHLGTRVIVHEMNHAAAAIYGSTLPASVKAVRILHQGNETLAYLQSDLTANLVDRLYELGYYAEAHDE